MTEVFVTVTNYMVYTSKGLTDWIEKCPIMITYTEHGATLKMHLLFIVVTISYPGHFAATVSV